MGVRIHVVLVTSPYLIPCLVYTCVCEVWLKSIEMVFHTAIVFYIYHCVLHVDGCGLKEGLTWSWRQPLGLAALDIQ